MEIRQLEYFREIATTGSINEAARRLNMSQPPLSYQMKQLEAELNVTLFERNRTGVTLTEAGKLLYERAAAWSKKIDWLIGPFPLMGLPSSRRLIARYLELGHVLAIHFPRPDKDTEGWRKNAQHICETADDGLPVPVFGDEPGKRYEL